MLGVQFLALLAKKLHRFLAQGTLALPCKPTCSILHASHLGRCVEGSWRRTPRPLSAHASMSHAEKQKRQCKSILVSQQPSEFASGLGVRGEPSEHTNWLPGATRWVQHHSNEEQRSWKAHKPGCSAVWRRSLQRHVCQACPETRPSQQVWTHSEPAAWLAARC